MWIRSQDKKTLIDAKAIRIESTANRHIVTKVTNIVVNDQIVAEYDTEDEALKVLDNLHYFINSKEFNVLDMPQKGVLS